MDFSKLKAILGLLQKACWQQGSRCNNVGVSRFWAASFPRLPRFILVMVMQIKDHVFLVTGASSGIGLSTSIMLAERRAKVALLARSKDALAELAVRLPGSLPIVADMTDFAGVRQAVQKVHQHYGSIDGLINNAR